MFGGQGSDEMLQIERELPDLQLVLMCGHNRALAERLKDRRAGAPRAVVGFTAEVSRHLQLGDLFIGKPGPGCLSEALQLGLPAITLCNRRTLPQERYNTEWLLEQGAGRVLSSWRELGPAVEQVFAQHEAYLAALERIDNRAVFELPRMLERILRAQPALLHDQAARVAAPLREALHEG
jgi:UDP-N-acetylglucosamine:LPS N-acetylglucosamine transferase